MSPLGSSPRGRAESPEGRSARTGAPGGRSPFHFHPQAHQISDPCTGERLREPSGRGVRRSEGQARNREPGHLVRPLRPGSAAANPGVCTPISQVGTLRQSGSARPNSHRRRGRPRIPTTTSPGDPSNLTGAPRAPPPTSRARATTFSAASSPPDAPPVKLPRSRCGEQTASPSGRSTSLRSGARGAAVRGGGADTNARVEAGLCHRARRPLPPRGKLTARRPPGPRTRAEETCPHGPAAGAEGRQVAGPGARGAKDPTGRVPAPDCGRLPGAASRGGARPAPTKAPRPSACAAHPAGAAVPPRAPRGPGRSPRRAPRREARGPPRRTAASGPDSPRAPAGKALTPAAKVQRPTQVRPGRALSLGNGAHARAEDSGKCSPQSLSALPVRKGRFRVGSPLHLHTDVRWTDHRQDPLTSSVVQGKCTCARPVSAAGSVSVRKTKIIACSLLSRTL